MNSTWMVRGALLGACIALAGCNSAGEDLLGFGGPSLGDQAVETARAFVTDEITPMVTTSLGQDVELACDVKKTDLGKKIDSRPESGRASYTLYDTKPGSTSVRDFYVTGFSDGCPRKISAALAVFGSVELYEMVHYSGLVDPAGADTDLAYGELRRKACGASNKPCTGNGLKTISRQTAFLQAYPRKGSSAHVELLMHRGDLAAISLK